MWLSQIDDDEGKQIITLDENFIEVDEVHRIIIEADEVEDGDEIELHEKNESTYTSENEYNVCEKHLKNLKMICMKII